VREFALAGDIWKYAWALSDKSGLKPIYHQTDPTKYAKCMSGRIDMITAKLGIERAAFFEVGGL
jgi:hypothetical protein